MRQVCSTCSHSQGRGFHSNLPWQCWSFQKTGEICSHEVSWMMYRSSSCASLAWCVRGRAGSSYKEQSWLSLYKGLPQTLLIASIYQLETADVLCQERLLQQHKPGSPASVKAHDFLARCFVVAVGSQAELPLFAQPCCLQSREVPTEGCGVGSIWESS